MAVVISWPVSLSMTVVGTGDATITSILQKQTPIARRHRERRHCPHHTLDRTGRYTPVPVQYQNRIDEKRSKSQRLLKGRMDLPSTRKGVKGSP